MFATELTAQELNAELALELPDRAAMQTFTASGDHSVVAPHHQSNHNHQSISVHIRTHTTQNANGASDTYQYANSNVTIYATFSNSGSNTDNSSITTS